MEISLPSDLGNWVQQKVDNGTYPSPTDVVRAGLRLLQEQEEQQQKLANLRQALAIGREQIRQGKCGPLNAKETLARIRKERAGNSEGNA